VKRYWVTWPAKNRRHAEIQKAFGHQTCPGGTITYERNAGSRPDHGGTLWIGLQPVSRL